VLDSIKLFLVVCGKRTRISSVYDTAIVVRCVFALDTARAAARKRRAGCGRNIGSGKGGSAGGFGLTRGGSFIDSDSLNVSDSLLKKFSY
jgi:hypothetical protein